MPKLTKLLGSVAIAACLAGAAFAQDTKDLKADTVVATVDGQDVTLGQMITVREGLPPEYLQLPDDVLFNGILDQLVQQTALSKIGEGMKTKKDDIALEVERRAYLAGIVLDKTATDAASDAAIQKAYDEKFVNAAPGVEYHAAHIIVPTEDEAKAVKADIDGGKDFAEEAKEKSQDGAAQNGGDLGWFTLDKMVPEFSEVIATMKPDEVVGPIQTQYGWHVVKLFDSRPAQTPTLDEVRDQISAELRQTAVQDRVTDTLKSAKVVKETDGLDPAVLKDTTILGK
ncbi:peptidylprolyl isomerase [Paenirhodobacter populi]|uniref:Parvulin-like PPIase n=1 Tax=Paenirhodobacter populi TaxID=2306993 RepID=A0A443J1I5_9RHOB|nr:peptidylprolyl isomerase [Sinirhodobacter populi]RWR14290.1 peptidylprolyl isomerase [Sinirhodobacter populi]